MKGKVQGIPGNNAPNAIIGSSRIMASRGSPVTTHLSATRAGPTVSLRGDANFCDWTVHTLGAGLAYVL